MDPSCLVTTVQVGGGGVMGGVFLAHFRLLSANWANLPRPRNATAYLSSDHVYLFMATMYPIL